MLQALLADLHGKAHDRLAQEDPHLAVVWHLMRDNRPIVIALFEQAMAAGPGAGLLWRRLIEDTRVLREHLEHLRETGHSLPGDPELVAAAMGGMLSMLAYALLGDDPESGRSDDEVIDTLTRLLLTASPLRAPRRHDQRRYDRRRRRPAHSPVRTARRGPAA
ncbi:hypothetical protein [Microbispora siamensis]|uniref:Uncharacterized protein n=1 Tax=Microbispora siamensis TaxID=564413 RepID=A0ABQ4GD36_9ACTN|nr:hypothetical protein [Microbispora siamensis]GIH59332.1 hypothetical protein Msi02_01490 [Microbispora siamensis]